ncbi:hypothetical protein RyT2_25510 [Pseudolactococcus yaeyamensis]
MTVKKRNKGIVILIVMLCAVIAGIVYHKVQADEKARELKMEKPIPKPNKIPKDKSDMKTFKSE